MIRAQTREPAQRRGKSLFYRGVVRVLAVSPLMESRAGGVEHERNFIFHYRELNLIDRSALFKPLDRIFLFEAFNDRFFDYRLAVAHAEKVGIDGIALDGERIVCADPLLPREGACALKKLLEAMRLERAEKHKHALGKARADICAGKNIFVAAEKHAAVFGADIRRLHISELFGYRCLKTQQTGYCEIYIHQNYLSKLLSFSHSTRGAPGRAPCSEKQIQIIRHWAQADRSRRRYGNILR